MSSLWNLGASIVGASAEVATTAASGVGTAVYTGTTKVVNTTADVATGSLRRVGSTVSPYIPTGQISSVAQFAYTSTYYVSDNTIRAVQLLPNILELCKTKETQNITLCCYRIIEKVLALLKGDEVTEITKLLMKIARSETTSQLLLEIKSLLLELFALLRTSEADALKNQLRDLVEGLQGIAREHQRQEAAKAGSALRNEHKQDDSKEEVQEELDNPPSSPPVLKNIGGIGSLDESERELVRAVVMKAPNCATVVKKLALLDITEAKATELWNERLTSEMVYRRESNRRYLPAGGSLVQNRSSELTNVNQGAVKNCGIITLLKSGKESDV